MLETLGSWLLTPPVAPQSHLAMGTSDIFFLSPDVSTGSFHPGLQ